MKFVVQFVHDTPAFGDSAATWTAETARILREVADGLDVDAPRDGTVWDAYGQYIGWFGPRPTNDGDVGTQVAETLLDMGFALQRAGGRDTAWAYRLQDGTEVLLTDADGGHRVVSGWLLCTYASDGSTGEMFEFKPSELAPLFERVRALIGRLP